MIWSDQSSCWHFVEQFTTHFSLADLLNIYKVWYDPINHMIIALKDHAIIPMEARYNDMIFEH